MSSPGRRAPRRPRLFWRVFVHGLLLIAGAAVSTGAVFHFFGEGAGFRDLAENLGAWLADGGEDELGRRLDDLYAITGQSGTVFSPDGTSLARAGDPLEPLGPEEAAELGAARWTHRDGGPALAIPIRAKGALEGAYLLVRFPGGGPHRFGIAIAVVLGVVLLLTVPLVRAIVRPLERITRTARRLGEGELAARTGLGRRRDEVGVLARTLDEMAERLDERLRADKELLADVSHELRTPLARIRVALELLEDGAAPVEETRDELADIADDVTELEALVADVLETARLDLLAANEGEGGLHLCAEPLRPEDLATEARGRFAAAHPDRELRVAVDDGLPSLRADAALVRRALDNLLDNAVQYSDAHEPVELVVRAGDGTVDFEVRDSGIGVPPAEIDRIFEPFHRTDASRSRRGGGTGLGLALVRRIAAAHGGRAFASNRDGGGARFTVALPAARGEDAERARESAGDSE